MAPSTETKREERPKIIVIAGPTASGKTNFSVGLAHSLAGEVVNADSMQVYRGMDIGTAKPTIEERGAIPHHLLDVVDPDEPFDAAHYQSTAGPVARKIASGGKTCFVVGGTGLYIKALLYGLFDCPPVDENLRAGLIQEWEYSGSEKLYRRLKRHDPEYAQKVHPHDRIRVTRGLEILHATGRPPSEISREHGFRKPRFSALKLYLHTERDELYRRINRRALRMVEAGLAEETEHLLKEGYSPQLKPMQAIGYRHMVQYLDGKLRLQEAMDMLQRDTRRYAKRQLTWFRADPEGIWISPADTGAAARLIRRFLKPLDQQTF